MGALVLCETARPADVAKTAHVAAERLADAVSRGKVDAMTERCETCQYWGPHVVGTGKDTIHECRRFPPGSGGFATVLLDDWCGEWRARPDDVAPMSMDELVVAGATFLEREP